jgi:hypothetical protein
MPGFEFAYSIEDTGDSLSIVIQNRTDQLTLVWSAGGLAIAILAEVLLILAVFGTLGVWHAVGVLVSVAGVFVVGYLAFRIFAPLFMWQLDGQETLIVSHRELKITRSAFGYVRQQTYRWEQLEPLRVMSAEHDVMYKWYRRRWIVRPASVSGPFEVGWIGFDCGGVTHRFGSGLVPAEAEDIVDRIREFRRRREHLDGHPTFEQ